MKYDFMKRIDSTPLMDAVPYENINITVKPLASDIT